MAIIRMGFSKNPYLGAFSLCTDKIALMPSNLHFSDQEVGAALKVPVVRTDVDRSPLIGILAKGNSKAILCSELFEMGGGIKGENPGVSVEQVPGKFNAFGNIILSNDHGAIVSPDVPDEVLAIVSEKLGVPAERGTIAGIKNVGAVAVATNRGALVHPDAKAEEVKLIEKTLGVPVEVGTACGGIKFVGLCMAANSNGAIVGMTSTGPELGRVESALGFI